MKTTALRSLGMLLAMLAVMLPARAQDDPFAAAARFDGQKRACLLAVRDQVNAAGTDRAKLAEVEAKLIAALSTAEATPEGLQEICRFLWIAGGEACVLPVAKLLADPKTADMARYTLQANPSAIAGKALRDAAASASGAAKVGLVNSIGQRADAAATALLTPLADDANADLRSAALWALGRIGTIEAAKALTSARTQDLANAQARALCAERLAAAGKTADAEKLYLALTAAGTPSAAKAAALRGLALVKSTKALDLAIAGLKDENLHVRQVAAKLASLLADKTTAQRYREAYPSLSADAQFAVLGAFADRGDPAAGPLALDALKTTDPAMRAVAMVVASAAGTPELVEPLVAIALADAGQARAVRDTLARFKGTAADPAMLALLTKGTPEQSAFIVAPICDRGIRSALPALLEILRGKDVKLAKAVVAGLPRVCQPGDLAALLQTLLAAPDKGVRDSLTTQILTVARRAEPAAATKAVTDLLAKAPTEQRVTLVGMLPGLGTDAALAALVAATKDADAEVRAAAVDALAGEWDDARALAPLLELVKTSTDADLVATALDGAVSKVAADDKLSGDDRVKLLAQILPLAKEAGTKRAIITQLRGCRVAAAVEMAAGLLDDAKVFTEAAGCVIYLAAEQKVGNRQLAAVKGPSTTAALRKVIDLAKDEGLKAQAGKLL